MGAGKMVVSLLSCAKRCFMVGMLIVVAVYSLGADYIIDLDYFDLAGTSHGC